MGAPKKTQKRQQPNATTRRDFLGKATMTGAGLLVGSAAFGVSQQQPNAKRPAATSANTSTVSGRRKLGSLEVSSIGLGVQNMSRTYQTTIPSRPEMINIIRTAFDRGVTFFDAAEGYGPLLTIRD